MATGKASKAIDRLQLPADFVRKKADPPRWKGLPYRKLDPNYFWYSTSGAAGNWRNGGSGFKRGALESLVQQKQQELQIMAVAAKAMSDSVRIMVVVFLLVECLGK